MFECVICNENSEEYCEYDCKHELCLVCGVRLLFLYKDKSCPLCRKASEKFKFCDLKENSRGKIVIKDVCYQSEEIRKKIEGLLSKKCQKCSRSFGNMKSLGEHYKTEHEYLVCRVCLEGSKVFWYEIKQYSPGEIIKHNRGELKEDGFEGHTKCVHCNWYFYDRDSAKRHSREKHQICSICEILGIPLQFYKNMKDIETHYLASHYCCRYASCRKIQCYVFPYKSDLWRHSLEFHGLSLNISDIHKENIENPSVFSLFRKPAIQTSETVPKKKNVLFPAFGSKEKSVIDRQLSEDGKKKAEICIKKIKNLSIGLPDFMCRKQLVEDNTQFDSRMKIIEKHTKIFTKDINNRIEEYLKGKKPLDLLIKEMEECVPKKTVLGILESVILKDKQAEMNNFLVRYRKEIRFPPFQKRVTEIQNLNRIKERKKGVGFRIIESKKK